MPAPAQPFPVSAPSYQLFFEPTAYDVVERGKPISVRVNMSDGGYMLFQGPTAMEDAQEFYRGAMAELSGEAA